MIQPKHVSSSSKQQKSECILEDCCSFYQRFSELNFKDKPSRWSSELSCNTPVICHQVHLMTDLDLVNGQLSQHFTLSVPVDTEVFDLQLLLSEELLDLQKKTTTNLTSKDQTKSLINKRSSLPSNLFCKCDAHLILTD